mmetsp:Transcript_1212/g.2317  ORF Transcript_1212/g.2317 Transcript_1212/m.2317 type:complete len:705 (-) Transcript_1212:1035-3149(-)
MVSQEDEECVELTASGEPEEAKPFDESKSSGIRIDDSVGETWRIKYHTWRNQRYVLPRKFRLRTEENARKYSVWSVNFIILASAVNTKMLNPNFAIMCTPGAHEDSFDSTEPFGFNSATYFLPMTTLIGVAISSVFIGKLSDRYGRKILLLILGWISAAGSIVKFYTSGTFWGFCLSNFIFGFFLGNLPVGMAYVGDIEPSKKKKDEMLGALVGMFVLGNSGGGIIAVLMNDSGLFAPLWVGAGIMVIAAITTHVYMIEPGDEVLEPGVDEKLILTDDEDIIRPDIIDKKTLWNIVGGAILDNIGSTGLFPLCLSPLALTEFYSDFVGANPPQDPIMTITAYQWLSVCVALLVIPATQMTPYCFVKLGVAGTCVFGNFCTAVVTGLLLLIGNLPSTTLAFGFFVAVMYGGFPFTVFSQLTTGPMLDSIAPEDKIGFVQGLNNAAMNFGMALAPWAFGILADYAGTNVSIGIAIGFSLLAALANSPLMWHPLMGRPKQKAPLAQRKLPSEDEELFKKIVDGEVIDPELAFQINQERGFHGKPSVVPRVKPYDEEKDHLDDISKEAAKNFQFRLELYNRVLAGLESADHDPENLVFDKDELVQMLNTLKGNDQSLVDQSSSELGEWMGQYLKDNGYSPHTTSILMKQMFMSSFPPLMRDDEFTEENVKEYLLNSKKVLSRYAEQETKASVTKTLASSMAMHPSGWW